MVLCAVCSKPVGEDESKCPSCGALIEVDLAATKRMPFVQTPAEPAPRSDTSSSLESLSGGRFQPGEILGGRYRVIDMLGRGGMGEVYRAEDIKLRVHVALKFLPERLAGHADQLERLYHEVSVARQVSHRNVCRVYDIGEDAGLHFISMEFVRGEELGSLLKRIGRLPEDKAIEVARQICAGLAAIHDKGILHRDLKPANIMLDQQGDVRITDFGLAATVDDLKESDQIAGTLVYMSPEQLAGEDLTASSDIYSLGLVLYELFTGRRAFEAESYPELVRLRKSETSLTTPTSLVKHLDPLIEQTILRCLEPEPGRRPSSALQVAAALPGGDPLAAALALGEMPSPEVVAAASKEGTLKPAVALICLALTILLSASVLLLSEQTTMNRIVPLERSNEIQRARASELIRRFGYTKPPTDSAFGWSYSDFLTYIRNNDLSTTRWDQLRSGQPSGMYFWYRESPRYLIPSQRAAYRTDVSDPEMVTSGMTRVYLDPAGRLYYFEAVPPQVEDQPATVSQTDWRTFFLEAGLEPERFRPDEPKWASPSASDTRAAWVGTYPARPDIPIRVEAASYHGSPVYFQIIEPWTIPNRMQDTAIGQQQQVGQMVLGSFVLCALIIGGILAWRNVRLRLGDRRGAFRLASAIVVLGVINWILTASHAPTNREFLLFMMMAMRTLFFASLMWLFYVSLEPLVRRWWPQMVIAWNRLVAGDWRDPLVGRDILVGCLIGPIFPMIYFLSMLISRWLDLPYQEPHRFYESMLSGLAVALGSFAWTTLAFNVFITFGLLLVFVILYIILRNVTLATAVFWVLCFLLLASTMANELMVNVIAGVVGATLMVFVLKRFGFLSFFVTSLVGDFFFTFPITTDPSVWYFDVTLLSMSMFAALLLYGFYVSLGGQKLFRGSLIPE